jgi:hypothetical protein
MSTHSRQAGRTGLNARSPPARTVWTAVDRSQRPRQRLSQRLSQRLGQRLGQRVDPGDHPRRAANTHVRFVANPFIAILVVICGIAITSTPATAAGCLGEHVHYGSSGLHANRQTAEDDALRVWRAVRARVTAPAGERATPQPKDISCIQTKDRTKWRCHIKGPRCRVT